jgi:5-(carboxyamino)imidazole ribonucleotide synthase
MPDPILPGATIGILGGGQLARMLALAARPMGYRIVVLDPDAACPAASVSDLVIATAYDSAEGLAQLAATADVVTLEFENVPSSALEALEERVPLRPSRRVLEIARDRVLEKTFLNEIGVETAPWAAVESDGDLAHAATVLGFPAILKTATLGYDGKGQSRVDTLARAQAAWAEMGQPKCVLESMVDFTMEISVIVARSPSGWQQAFAPFENQHSASILDVTLWPARIDDALADLAIHTAMEISREIDAIGLLTVEMFVVAAADDAAARVVVNEIAPRPHNSGHLTIEASPTSQFAQAIRAVCDLPLGEVTPQSPAAMANLLGDLWFDNDDRSVTPDWIAALHAGATVHLYGKRDARRGRKMGHLTTLAETSPAAMETVLAARSLLTEHAPRPDRLHG